jgi:tRNA dimethylallyltransferase
MFDKALADITSRGKSAIVVGGSTLYLAAALDNLFFAPTDEDLREKLEKEAASIGALSMHEKLAKLDPQAAEKIPASNRRRVIRAIEVITLSGKNYAANFPEPSYRVPTIQLAVDVPRAVLNERIRQRVERMWDSGLLAEVAELRRHTLSRTARVAIGYRQALAQLEGKLSQAEAIAETQLLTTRYAKKQGTWFRRDKRIHWLDSSSDRLPQALSVVRLER